MDMAQQTTGLGADTTPDWLAVSVLGDPNQAIGFGALGIAAALVFSNLGAAFGTAKSGCAIVEISA